MTKLTIGLPVPSIAFLPLWWADEKGFFKEEGLTEVKLPTFRGEADVIQALAGGSLDVNVSSLAGLVSSISSEQTFKGIWAGYNIPLFDWYAHPRFKSIAETKGGRFAVSKFGGLTDMLTRYALHRGGLDVEYCRKAIDEIQDGWYADGRLPLKGCEVFWEIAVQAGDVMGPWPTNR